MVQSIVKILDFCRAFSTSEQRTLELFLVTLYTLIERQWGTAYLRTRVRLSLVG